MTATKLRKQRIVVLAAIAIGAGAIYWLQRDFISFSQLVRHEMRVRSWIAEQPVRAFFAGFGVYLLVSLIPGTTGKSFALGWFYGFWQGVVIVDCALTIAAVASFLISRYLLLDFVQARLRRFYHTINTMLERDGSFYLLTLRLMHAPYTLVNYAAGATGARVRTFWWTTQLGLLPGTIVCVLVGARLPSLAQLEEEGFWSLVDPLLVVGLGLTALLPLVIRGCLHWWRKRKATQ